MKRKRADHNQAEILKALWKIGCSTVVLSQVGGACPDILAARGGRSVLLEVKSKLGKLSPEQQEFHAWWEGEIAVVRSVDEAVAVFQTGMFTKTSAGAFA
jgi:hypothetical protein